MSNTQEPPGALTLSIPICGEGREAKGDPWLAGRTWPRAERHIFHTLGGMAGLRKIGMGERTDSHGTPLEVHYNFLYGDLAEATNRFVKTRHKLKLPEGTELIHWKVFPGGSIEQHLMIRWTSGGLYPVFTDLSDDNLYSRLAICRIA